MSYHSKTAAMTLANQHYVLVPASGNPDASMEAQATYAVSPEAAVEHMKAIYDTADFGCERHPLANLIRLATGNELPWNNPLIEVNYVKAGDRETTIRMEVDVLRELHEGEAVEIRPATVAEREAMFRDCQWEDDCRSEEEFDRGFNEAKDCF